MPDIGNEYIVLAIDPGVKGGIVWNEAGKTHATKMPDGVDEIVLFLQTFALKSRLIELHLENPGKGGWGLAATSGISKLFEQVGGIRYSALMVGWKVNLVTPQKWQAAHSLKREKGEGKTAWKNRLKLLACDLYPDHHVTLQTADALLIHSAAVRGLLF